MLQTPLIVEQTAEQDRKEAYRICADAIMARLDETGRLFPGAPGSTKPNVARMMERIAKTMRAAGDVALTAVVPETPVSDQPKLEDPQLTKPVVQALASTKVNGSNH